MNYQNKYKDQGYSSGQRDRLRREFGMEDEDIKMINVLHHKKKFLI